MKLGIKITVFLILMVGRLGVCDFNHSLTVDPNTGKVDFQDPEGVKAKNNGTLPKI